MEWTTPTRGKFTYEQMIQEIRKYIESDFNFKYKIIVGNDSQRLSTRDGLKTRFVNAITVLRIGRGGQYYYYKEDARFMKSLREKIYQEVNSIIMNIMLIRESLNDLVEQGLVIIKPDVDIGNKGKTKDLVKEIEGIFKSAGYEKVATKPYSICSSAVADRHSK